MKKLSAVAVVLLIALVSLLATRSISGDGAHYSARSISGDVAHYSQSA